MPFRVPVERRRLTLIIITLCLHILLWSSLVPLITTVVLFATEEVDGTFLPSAVLILISASSTLFYITLHVVVSFKYRSWSNDTFKSHRLETTSYLANRLVVTLCIVWLFTTGWALVVAARQPVCHSKPSDGAYWQAGSACVAEKLCAALSFIALIASCALFGILTTVRRPFEAHLLGSIKQTPNPPISPPVSVGGSTLDLPPPRCRSRRSPSLDSCIGSEKSFDNIGLGIYNSMSSLRTPSRLSKVSVSSTTLRSSLQFPNKNNTTTTTSIRPTSASPPIPARSPLRPTLPLPLTPSKGSGPGLYPPPSAYLAMHPPPAGPAPPLPLLSPRRASSLKYTGGQQRPDSGISYYSCMTSPSGPPPPRPISVRPVPPSPALLALQARQSGYANQGRGTPNAGSEGGVVSASAAWSSCDDRSIDGGPGLGGVVQLQREEKALPRKPVPAAADGNPRRPQLAPRRESSYGSTGTSPLSTMRRAAEPEVAVLPLPAMWAGAARAGTPSADVMTRGKAVGKRASAILESWRVGLTSERRARSVGEVEGAGVKDGEGLESDAMGGEGRRGTTVLA